VADVQSTVDFPSMQSAKTEFENASTQAKDSRKKVQGSKDYAVSAWKGESATGYFAAIDSWLDQFDVVTTNLDNLTSALDAALKGYQAGEGRNVGHTSKLTSVIHGN